MLSTVDIFISHCVFSANFAVQIPCAHYLYIVLNWLVCWLVRNKKLFTEKKEEKNYTTCFVRF